MQPLFVSACEVLLRHDGLACDNGADDDDDDDDHEDDEDEDEEEDDDNDDSDDSVGEDATGDGCWQYW